MEDDFQFVLCEGCRQESPNLKLLTCLHTLCLDCLSENKPIRQCPVCRTAIPQASGIPDMDNLLFTNLQAKLSIYKKIRDSDGPNCSRCRGESATVWCSECEEFLCAKCFEDHQWFFKKRSHEARKVEELRAESAHQFLEDTRKSCNLFCSRPEMLFSPLLTYHIYCKRCEKALCCSCALLDSQHAPFCDIRSETQCRQEELGTMNQELKQKRSGFEATYAALQDEAARLEEAQREMRELIGQRVEQLVRLIRQEEEELLGLAGERLVEKMRLYATEQEVMDMQPFIKDSLDELQRLQPPAAGDRAQSGDLAKCRARLQALVERVMGHPGEDSLWGWIQPPRRQQGLGPAQKPKSQTILPTFTINLEEMQMSPVRTSPDRQEPLGTRRCHPSTLHPLCSPFSRLSPSARGPSGGRTAWKQAARSHPREGHPKYLLQSCPFPSAAQLITEVAAVNREHTFKTLIRTPESVLALLSQGVPIEVGMQHLLWYLSPLPRPILIVYNFWALELPALFKALDATGRKVDFCRIVGGYVDMLSLIKEKLPKAPSYKLKNLLRRHLQQQLNEGSALATAKALQELWGALELPDCADAGMMLTHCNLQSYTILRPLVQEKLLTRRAAKILARRSLENRGATGRKLNPPESSGSPPRTSSGPDTA
uniref:Protein PML n=1 Tax=Buteo japonicus TaxID=224669 RepID=A0A8C0AQG8_9AVES